MLHRRSAKGGDGTLVLIIGANAEMEESSVACAEEKRCQRCWRTGTRVLELADTHLELLLLGFAFFENFYSCFVSLGQ